MLLFLLVQMACQDVGAGFCAFDPGEIFEARYDQTFVVSFRSALEDGTFPSGVGQLEVVQRMGLVFHLAVPLKCGVEIGRSPVAVGDQADDRRGADIVTFRPVGCRGEPDGEQLLQR